MSAWTMPMATTGTAGIDGEGEADGGGMVTLASTVLGEVMVPAAALFTFPAGLVGFEAYRRFALVPTGHEAIWWLQSVDEPGLAFVAADPFLVAAGYDPDVPDAELAALGPGAREELLVLAIVTLAAAAGGATANLRAPVVLNTGTRRARQVVLPDGRWDVAEPVRLGDAA